MDYAIGSAFRNTITNVVIPASEAGGELIPDKPE